MCIRDRFRSGRRLPIWIFFPPSYGHHIDAFDRAAVESAIRRLRPRRGSYWRGNLTTSPTKSRFTCTRAVQRMSPVPLLSQALETSKSHHVPEATRAAYKPGEQSTSCQSSRRCSSTSCMAELLSCWIIVFGRNSLAFAGSIRQPFNLSELSLNSQASSTSINLQSPSFWT